LFAVGQNRTELKKHPYGNTLRYASELGNDRWLPRAEFQSNRFTTCWGELLIV